MLLLAVVEPNTTPLSNISTVEPPSEAVPDIVIDAYSPPNHAAGVLQKTKAALQVMYQKVQ